MFWPRRTSIGPIGWCFWTAAFCLFSPASTDALETPSTSVWVGLPESAPESVKVLATRLRSAVEQSGQRFLDHIPGTDVRDIVDPVTLQTGFIMGIEHYWAGRFSESRDLLQHSIAAVRRQSRLMRSGMVSASQIHQASLLMTRMHLEQGETNEAEALLKWLLFTFPAVEVTLENNPQSLVSLAEATRQASEIAKGTVEWLDTSGGSGCELEVNGARIYPRRKVELPAGTYRATVVCGNTRGWQRVIEINTREVVQLRSDPVVESEIVLLNGEIRSLNWPISTDKLKRISAAAGQPVTALQVRAHPAGSGMILTVEEVSNHEVKTHGWTPLTDSELDASTSALVLGTMRETGPGIRRQAKGPSTTSWTLYGAGAALFVGGVVTNWIHNSGDPAQDVEDLNGQADLRTTSFALYGSGGAVALTGLVLHILDTTQADGRGELQGSGEPQTGETTVWKGENGFR